MKKYVIATSRKWHRGLAKRLEIVMASRFETIERQEDLSFDHLNEIKPRYVFFPHWSYIIPEEIFLNFECIIFHMTDVPFGRGGSPLQNLIARGIYETKISAIKCIGGVDAGPVYLKRPLSLYGGAEEIYLRSGKVIEEMIIEIIKNEPQSVEQKGEVVLFERRQPKQSDISGLMSLEKVFDHIRMLDADGYPHAFLDIGKFRFEFTRAAYKHGRVLADVTITERKENEEWDV